MITKLVKIRDWNKTSEISHNIKSTRYSRFSGGEWPPTALNIELAHEKISPVLKIILWGLWLKANYLKKIIFVMLLSFLFWIRSEFLFKQKHASLSITLYTQHFIFSDKNGEISYFYFVWKKLNSDCGPYDSVKITWPKDKYWQELITCV